MGAHNTKIVVSSDLDEFAIAGLRGDPVDVFGVGTSLVTGSGAPTAGMVYKLVEVEGRPVAKRSRNKASYGGAKRAVRTSRNTGTAVEEVGIPLCQRYPHHRHVDGHRIDGAAHAQWLRAGGPAQLAGIPRVSGRAAGHPALGRTGTLP